MARRRLGSLPPLRLPTTSATPITAGGGLDFGQVLMSLLQGSELSRKAGLEEQDRRLKAEQLQNLIEDRATQRALQQATFAEKQRETEEKRATSSAIAQWLLGVEKGREPVPYETTQEVTKPETTQRFPLAPDREERAQAARDYYQRMVYPLKLDTTPETPLGEPPAAPPTEGPEVTIPGGTFWQRLVRSRTPTLEEARAKAGAPPPGIPESLLGYATKGLRTGEETQKDYLALQDQLANVTRKQYDYRQLIKNEPDEEQKRGLQREAERLTNQGKQIENQLLGYKAQAFAGATPEQRAQAYGLALKNLPFERATIAAVVSGALDGKDIGAPGMTKELGALTLKAMEAHGQLPVNLTTLMGVAAGTIPPGSLGLPELTTIQASQLAKNVQDFEIQKAKATAEIPHPTPEKVQELVMNFGFARAMLNDLATMGSRLNLSRLVGGFSPWINAIVQRWSGPGAIGKTPDAGRPVLETGLSDEEARFVALTANYADMVLRMRSGAQINEQEMKRMLEFLPWTGVTGNIFMARVKLEQDLMTLKQETWSKSLPSMGYRAPFIPPMSLSTPPAPVEGFTPRPTAATQTGLTPAEKARQEALRQKREQH